MDSSIHDIFKLGRFGNDKSVDSVARHNLDGWFSKWYVVYLLEGISLMHLAV